MSTSIRCSLGHTQRSYECPACAEVHGSGPQPIEYWKWFRTRTTSKRIKALVDDHIERDRVRTAIGALRTEFGENPQNYEETK